MCTHECVCTYMHTCTCNISFVSYLKTDVLQDAEVFCVHLEVLHEPGVVYVVGVVFGEREVTEAHHFLGSVGRHRFVDTGPSLQSIFLQEKAFLNKINLAIPRKSKIKYLKEEK